MKKQVSLILTVIFGTILFCISAAHASTAYVDNGGREWRQVSDTLGLTWFDVITVCDENTGDCDGSVGEVDLTGWQWADVATVNLLFNEISNGAGFLTSDPQEYEIQDTTWAPAAIDNDGTGSDTGYFNMTWTNFSSGEEFVYGWTRDRKPDSLTGAYLGTITDSPTFDKLQTDNSSNINQENPAITGFWMYQDQTTTVPIPGAVWLLLSGLTGLVAFRRKKQA